MRRIRKKNWFLAQREAVGVLTEAVRESDAAPAPELTQVEMEEHREEFYVCFLDELFCRKSEASVNDAGSKL